MLHRLKVSQTRVYIMLDDMQETATCEVPLFEHDSNH
jgi:hypothetical protein